MKKIFSYLFELKNEQKSRTVIRNRSQNEIKTCKNGHQFYKSSDCPTCPICEELRKPEDNFLFLLAAPARRSLENKGITSLEQLSKFTEKEVLSFHGMGKSSIPKLRNLLVDNGLEFKAM